MIREFMLVYCPEGNMSGIWISPEFLLLDMAFISARNWPMDLGGELSFQTDP